MAFRKFFSLFLCRLQALLSPCRRAFRSNFVSRVAQTFITQSLMIVISLLTSVILARILGPEGRGLYAVASIVNAIGIQFFNFGLHSSNTYYVARDRKLLPALLGNSLLIGFGCGSLAIVLAGVAFSIWPHLAPVQGLLLLLALVSVPFSLVYMLLQKLLIGIDEVSSYNKIDLAIKIIGIILIGLVILLRQVTVEMLFSANLITLAIGFVWCLWSLITYISVHPWPSFSLLRDSLGYGLKAYLASFFSLMVLRSDLLMVKHLLGEEQAGYYSIAASMADMVYMLPCIIATLLFPKLSALPTISEKWKFTKKVIATGGPLVIFLGGSAVLVAEPLVKFLFGVHFLPAATAFIWLLPGIIFLGIQTIAVQFLNSVGFPKVIVLVWAGSFLLNFTLNTWAIPSYGIKGASLASSASYIFAFACIILTAKKYANQRLPDHQA